MIMTVVQCGVKVGLKSIVFLLALPFQFVQHVMQVNPHVTSILQSQYDNKPGGHCIARNACSNVDVEACNIAMAGVSAFAFQGTNAHAIMGTSLGILAIGIPNACIWKRKRAWCVSIFSEPSCSIWKAVAEKCIRGSAY